MMPAAPDGVLRSTSSRAPLDEAGWLRSRNWLPVFWKAKGSCSLSAGCLLRATRPKLQRPGKARDMPDHHQAVQIFDDATGDIALGELDAAIAIQECIRLDPEYFDAWHALGMALMKAGRFPEAIQAGLRAVELNPDDQLAWSSLSLFYVRNGQVPGGSRWRQSTHLVVGRQDQGFGRSVKSFSSPRRSIIPMLRRILGMRRKILADVIARYHRLKGEPTFFLTGVDQHGQKVQQAAQKGGVPVEEFVGETTTKFVALWKRLDLSYDVWAATTDPLHKSCVQQILQSLPTGGNLQGDLPRVLQRPPGTISHGWRLNDGTFGSEWGEVIELEEENWYFRLAKHREWLLDFLDAHGECVSQLFVSRNCAMRRKSLLAIFRFRGRNPVFPGALSYRLTRRALPTSGSMPWSIISVLPAMDAMRPPSKSVGPRCTSSARIFSSRLTASIGWRCLGDGIAR